MRQIRDEIWGAHLDVHCRLSFHVCDLTEHRIEVETESPISNRIIDPIRDGVWEQIESPLG